MTVVIASKTVFNGNWVRIDENKIKKLDGTIATHEIAIRKNAVLIVANIDNRLCMVNQYRYPANLSLWEFPTGFINDNEKALHAAKREFEEETGYIPTNIKLISKLWTWPNFSTQRIYIYYANKFNTGNIKCDSTETDLKSRFVSLDEIITMIKNNKIITPITLSVITLLSSKGLFNE